MLFRASGMALVHCLAAFRACRRPMPNCWVVPRSAQAPPRPTHTTTTTPTCCPLGPPRMQADVVMVLCLPLRARKCRLFGCAANRNQPAFLEGDLHRRCCCVLRMQRCIAFAHCVPTQPLRWPIVHAGPRAPCPRRPRRPRRPHPTRRRRPRGHRLALPCLACLAWLAVLSCPATLHTVTAKKHQTCPPASLLASRCPPIPPCPPPPPPPPPPPACSPPAAACEAPDNQHCVWDQSSLAFLQQADNAAACCAACSSDPASAGPLWTWDASGACLCAPAGSASFPQPLDVPVLCGTGARQRPSRPVRGCPADGARGVDGGGGKGVAARIACACMAAPPLTAPPLALHGRGGLPLTPAAALSPCAAGCCPAPPSPPLP